VSIERRTTPPFDADWSTGLDAYRVAREHVDDYLQSPWIAKLEQCRSSLDRALAFLEDFQHSPRDGARHDRFGRAWPALRERYGERFGRMWSIYLLVCAAAFRSRRYQLWQFVLSARGAAGGYRRPGLAAGAIEAQPAPAAQRVLGQR
jgi:hypothetical protein